MDLIYSIAYTIIVTLLSFTDIDLSWITLIAMSAFLMLLSARFINFIAQSKKESLQKETTSV